jgi:hypothetical protein
MDITKIRLMSNVQIAESINPVLKPGFENIIKISGR